MAKPDGSTTYRWESVCAVSRAEAGVTATDASGHVYPLSTEVEARALSRVHPLTVTWNGDPAGLPIGQRVRVTIELLEDGDDG